MVSTQKKNSKKFADSFPQIAFRNPSSILVTGCAGFIGSNFTRAFREKFPKSKIIGIDDLSSGKKSALSDDVYFYKTSITNKKKVSEIFIQHKPEYVFHFAAIPRVSLSVEHPVKTSDANIMGTAVLLNESAKNGVKRFVFSSSSSVYGDTKYLPTNEDVVPNPQSPYALQKYVGELLCRQWSSLYGIDTVSLRYFNVFGPGQHGDSPYSTVAAAWLETIFINTKQKPFLEGDGKQSRDFCFVDDVVNANILAMKYRKNFNGKIFNIAGGERTSLKQVVKSIEKLTSKKLPLEIRPSRTGDVGHTHADIKKAMRILGYKPAFSFEEGLSKTIDWFTERARSNPKTI